MKPTDIQIRGVYNMAARNCGNPTPIETYERDQQDEIIKDIRTILSAPDDESAAVIALSEGYIDPGIFSKALRDIARKRGVIKS